MPGNRNRHPLVQLTDLPWWVSVVIAALVFAAIRWLGPSIAGTSPLLTPLAHALAANAHWFAAIFLLPIPFALLKTARRRKLVDGQATASATCHGRTSSDLSPRRIAGRAIA